MLAEHLETRRAQFIALADSWLQVGAGCVRLLDGGAVLTQYPPNGSLSPHPLIVHSRASNLILQIHGVKADDWSATAAMTLDLLDSLLTADTELESLTAALVETQDRLVALYELTQATRRKLGIPILLDLLLEQACHLLEVDGGFTVLLQPGQPALIHQKGNNLLSDDHIHVAASLYRRDTGRHTFKDAGTLPIGLRNVMMVSLPVREQVFAALGVYNKTGDFTSPDIKLAQSIADHIGAQLENAFLHEEALAHIRLETEMNVARQVQTSLLPQSIPAIPGLDVYAVSTPALQVGGDFYDVILRPAKPVVFMVGDVTGKGMPAALLMAMTHTIARAAVRNVPFTQPHEIVDRLNNDLIEDFSNVGMFSTVFVGMIDPATRQLSLCNAGHSPVVYAPASGDPILLEAQDIPIGVLDGYSFNSYSCKLSADDLFIVASDGFPETRNASGEMFGYERLKACLALGRASSAREIAQQLFDAVTQFSGNGPQEDDRTVIVIKVR
ncbi:MAG: SpoIIE family protein phosphatase [Chloroflexi bacterium]|nr:SpoIIE family protein phosphatase [Chloroflexota bacterium]